MRAHAAPPTAPTCSPHSPQLSPRRPAANPTDCKCNRRVHRPFVSPLRLHTPLIPALPPPHSPPHQEDFGPKPLPAYDPLPPPAPLPHIPWEGESTSRSTYVAHPPQRRRPSIALALGGAAHVVLPSCVPLPADAEVQLTTTRTGQVCLQACVAHPAVWAALLQAQGVLGTPLPSTSSPALEAVPPAGGPGNLSLCFKYCVVVVVVVVLLCAGATADDCSYWLQDRMELAVLEGDAPAAADNRLLGTCSIAGLPRGARAGTEGRGHSQY